MTNGHVSLPVTRGAGELSARLAVLSQQGDCMQYLLLDGQRLHLCQSVCEFWFQCRTMLRKYPGERLLLAQQGMLFQRFPNRHKPVSRTVL